MVLIMASIFSAYFKHYRFSNSKYQLGNVSKRSLHRKLVGCVSPCDTNLHGDGAVTIHHISSDFNRRRKGKAHQRRTENYGITRLSVLAVLVHNLWIFRRISITRVGYPTLLSRSVSIHQLLPSFLADSSLQFKRNTHRIYDYSVFR